MEQNNDTQSTPVAVGATLMAEVGDRITASGSDVRQRLVDHFYEEEVTKRVELLTKAFAKRRELEGNVKKISRPDIEGTFNADGTEASAGTFSRKRLKEIEEAKKPLAKLERAMQKALESNDFGDLKNIVK